MADYNHSEILRPYGDDPGTVGIDRAALHGYWERRDGTEGGELMFDRMSDGRLELADYDGTFCLPRPVTRALRTAGFVVHEDFDLAQP